MKRISDINNRIECHILLSDVELPTDGVMLPFDKRMNTNPSKYKKLGMRKIKCLISDNPGYPFSMDFVWYDKNSGTHSELHNKYVRINFIDQKFKEIGR